MILLPPAATPMPFPMRLPLPEREHPPELYEAIVRECHSKDVRMAEILMSCGWTMVDAAWAAVNWDLRTLAAAIANERAKRKVRLTSLSDTDVAELKKQIQTEKKATQPIRPKRTTRIVPGINAPTNPHPPKKPEGPST